MTKQEQDLIDAINNFELNQENIPVELIKAYSLLRDKFNKIRSIPIPVFTENNTFLDKSVYQCPGIFYYKKNIYYHNM